MESSLPKYALEGSSLSKDESNSQRKHLRRAQYNKLLNALKENQIDAAKAIVSAGNVELNSTNFWSLLELIEDFQQELQQELVLFVTNLASEERLYYYIEMALSGDEDEERMATMVVKYCPKLLIENPRGESLIQQAASSGKVSLIRLCLEVFTLNDFKNVPSDGSYSADQTLSRTILESAAGGGHLEVVQMLVDFDKDLLDHGYPLNAAVKGGHLNVVQFLLTVKAELVRHVPPGPNKYSALFEIPSDGVPKDVSEKIKQLILARIVRARDPWESPAVTRNLLTGPQGTSLSNKPIAQTADCEQSNVSITMLLLKQ